MTLRRRRRPASSGQETPPTLDSSPGVRPGGHRPVAPPGGVSPRHLERRTVGLVALLVVGIWLVVVFGHALADANTINADAARARAENDALRARVEAGRREIAFIQTDTFLSLEARAYGMGRRGERAFALEPGAPSPPPLVPLGGEPSPQVPPTPLEEWVALLFGP
jgi:cell division protein FtsB